MKYFCLLRFLISRLRWRGDYASTLPPDCHSVAAQIPCDTQRTCTVPFTVFRTACCSRVLIMSGKSDVHADEAPKDKHKGKWCLLLDDVGVLDKLDKGISICVFGVHNCVNEPSKLLRWGEASKLMFNRVRTFLMQAIVTHLSLKDGKGLSCVRGWKTRRKKRIVWQWYCGQVEDMRFHNH